MASEKRPVDLRREVMPVLLHERECPVGYRCMALDCVECIQIHMAKGCESTDGEKGRRCPA